MRKFIIITIFIFISFKSFSKELDLGIHKIIFPNKYNIINWNETELGSALCQEFSTCFGLVDNKIFEIVNQINSGKNYEEIKTIQPIIKKYNNLLTSFSESRVKSLMKTTKTVLKKNNSGTIFTYFRTDVDINESPVFEEYGIDINEVRSMSQNELKKFTRDLKNEITSGKDFYMFMDGLFINFNKFSVSKNSRNEPYLIINGDITYLLTSSKIKLGDIAYYVSEVNNRLFVMDGYCIVNCKTFFSDFSQIIDQSFIPIDKSKDPFAKGSSSKGEDDLINQLEQLNELYKSGVLSEDEFKKAKKKILN
tara:strand:+ start:252 stop:1175 length:924 start_codon:yes stop_codon:yes gene_type:complete